MSIWRNLWKRPQAAQASPRVGVSPVVKNNASPYTMERIDADSAEIVLYGDIVSERPVDWWTGKPDDGQYIILSEFLEDMKKVEDVALLTLRIHSVGGNAYDALTIHNRLKSLGAEITVIVDGVAMSGGSIIMCAGSKVQVYPSSLIMIHRCWAYIWGGYNAAELRKMADGYDAADRSQATVYHIKTGIETKELLNMMEAETYMTGQEAINKGFADELVEGSGMEIAASADRSTLFVGGRPVWATSREGGIPAAIPTVNPEASAPVATNSYQPATAGVQEGGNKPMAKTLEELRKEYPELTAQLEAEARTTAPSAAPPDVPAAAPAASPAPSAGTTVDSTVLDPIQAERQRMQEIDTLASLYDAETIRAAKYGDTACTAQEMAYRAAQKAVKQGKSFLGDLEADTTASGVQSIGAAASPASAGDGESLTNDQLMAKGRADAQALNPKKEDQ